MGVFDISIPWEIADAAVAAAALALIALLVFIWAGESAAAWRPRRGALAGATAIGLLGALPAVFTWQLSAPGSAITSFTYPAYPAQLSGLWGAGWAFVDYYPLSFLWALPGIGLLMALPGICLALHAAWSRRKSTAATSRSGLLRAFKVGLCVAVLCEAGGFLLALAARTLAGGGRLNQVLYAGGNGPYLAIEWMSWLTITICAVAALITTRATRGNRLAAVLLTSWVATTAASFLLVPALFTTFCGTGAYSCAVELPHDLFAFYGILAAQTPVYAAIASVLCFGLVRVLRPVVARFGRERPAAATAPAVSQTGLPAPMTMPSRSWRRRGIGLIEAAILLAFLANVACGIYVFYTQVFAFS